MMVRRLGFVLKTIQRTRNSRIFVFGVGKFSSTQRSINLDGKQLNYGMEEMISASAETERKILFLAFGELFIIFAETIKQTENYFLIVL
jgi:hypothetical protein